MTSIFKSNKFFRIIKHFLLALPLMFILGISIYTIINPNAKDSFSGLEGYTENVYAYNTNVVDNTDNSTAFDSIVNGNIYKLTYSFTWASGTQNRTVFSYNNSYNNKFYILDYDTTATSYDVNGVLPTQNNNYQLNICLQGNSSNYILRSYSTRTGSNIIANGGNSAGVYNIYIVILDKSFLTIDNSSYLFVECPVEHIPFITETHYLSSLDRSFTYAMNEFNQIGFNKFDFVGLFDGIFTDNIHNVYTDFINSYINYYLMIECVYFVPWVIHIFIHFAYDLGDYFTSSFKRNRKEDD